MNNPEGLEGADFDAMLADVASGISDKDVAEAQRGAEQMSEQDLSMQIWRMFAAPPSESA